MENYLAKKSKLLNDSVIPNQAITYRIHSSKLQGIIPENEIFAHINGNIGRKGLPVTPQLRHA
ncbi:hypothetical protein [Methylobacillus flagellatus]|uniref:hypothetical protein n=1 Tax=Methylobacillus flagellatus TaxID=405 RepID=UPI000662A543|nr:hypothetical protein [Methylobacillus flagellatus]